MSKLPEAIQRREASEVPRLLAFMTVTYYKLKRHGAKGSDIHLTTLEHPLMAPDVAACALPDLPCPLLRSGRSCSGARSGVHSGDGGYGLVLGFHKQERIPLAEGID